jgi:3-oxoacyl-[acyl-carrier-protein] synthase II
VVVTGLGLATALGLDLEASWERALRGESGIARIAAPGTARSAVQAVGAIGAADGQRLRDAFPRLAAAAGERRTLFALWAAQAALRDAAATTAALDPQRCGVALAAGLGIYRLEDLRALSGVPGSCDAPASGDGPAGLHRESHVRNPSDRPAALLATEHGFCGYNATLTTACAAATQAIGTAFRAIRRGDADLMLAGGADSMINPVGLVSFVLLGAAAVGAGEPAALCRPFDRRRSGLVMGEGAGIAVLEEERHALRRGARIYARVAGYASSLDAWQVTAPHPQGAGAELAMRGALRDAGLEPGEIDYINAHGTSTKLNDAAETLAIKSVFGGRGSAPPISSSKPLFGHLLAASGGPEFVLTVLSTQRDAIHPTLNLEHPDPKCDLDYVPGRRRDTRVRAALSNSFGFGGQNASIVVCKHPQARGAA